MIAARAALFCQVITSFKRNIDERTPTTGAVRADMAAIAAGSLATSTAHKM